MQSFFPFLFLSTSKDFAIMFIYSLIYLMFLRKINEKVVVADLDQILTIDQIWVKNVTWVCKYTTAWQDVWFLFNQPIFPEITPG